MMFVFSLWTEGNIKVLVLCTVLVILVRDPCFLNMTWLVVLVPVITVLSCGCLGLLLTTDRWRFVSVGVAVKVWTVVLGSPQGISWFVHRNWNGLGFENVGWWFPVRKTVGLTLTLGNDMTCVGLMVARLLTARRNVVSM